MKGSSFRSDLPWGKECERAFGRTHPGYVEHTDGMEGDFTLPRRGDELLELKSESYSVGDPDSEENVEFRRAAGIPDPPDREWAPTRNIAVERWSSELERKPGGPWQAQGHGVKWYAHFFAGDGRVFAYLTDDLVEFMDGALKEDPNRFMEFRFDNGGYVTMGYVVPRAAVDHLRVYGLFRGDGIPKKRRRPR